MYGAYRYSCGDDCYWLKRQPALPIYLQKHSNIAGLPATQRK